MANAAETIKGITLELGGNDPALLLDDVDLSEKNMDMMASVVFRMSGQVCMAIKRVYVPTKIKDKFVNAFAKAADKVVVGDGLRPKVTMGPLHQEKGLIRGRGLVEDAETRGASVLKLGKIDDVETFEEGYFMQPTIVTDVDDDAPLMAEEQFCPALPITTYDDLDEAVAPRQRHDLRPGRFGLGEGRGLFFRWRGAFSPEPSGSTRTGRRRSTAAHRMAGSTSRGSGAAPASKACTNICRSRPSPATKPERPNSRF